MAPDAQKPAVHETRAASSPARVVLDPMKGEAVGAKASQQSKALDVQSGTWVWDGLIKALEVDLFSLAWEVRHGAATALRELLKVQGKCGGMKGLLLFTCSSSQTDEMKQLGRHLRRALFFTNNGASPLPLISFASSFSTGSVTSCQIKSLHLFGKPPHKPWLPS